MTKAKPKSPNPESRAATTDSEQRAALVEALHKIDPSWSGKRRACQSRLISAGQTGATL